MRAYKSDIFDPKPRGERGTIDWEAFFEDGEMGLISLINRASNIVKIKKCVGIIIDTLYMREEDAPNKEIFRARMETFIPASPVDSSADFEKTKNSVALLLREIKEDRVQKSLAYVKEQKTDEVVKEERRLAEIKSTESLRATSQSAESVFVDVFCGAIEERLAVLRVRRAPGGATLPFILSPDFGTNFQAILRRNFAPVLANRLKVFIGRVEGVAEEKRKGFVEREFESRKGRAVIWEAWQQTWEDSLKQSEYPIKPKEEKESVLGLLSKKKPEHTPVWKKKELTLEEWEIEVKRIMGANRRAQENWASISAKSDKYHAPEDGDEELLKELFGRSASGIKNQIDALYQIATQGGDVGKIFYNYQDGKKLDLALLAGCYQKPNIFLRKTCSLKQFLAGFRDTQRRLYFPLTSRYLSDFM